MVLPACLVIALQGLPAQAPTDVTSGARVEREAWAMGTRIRLVADAPTEARARAATEAALGEVERLEALLSSWDPATELSRLNAAPVGQRVPLSDELHGLLVEAGEWRRRTAGAFEPVVGALVDAWDLRGPGRIPDAADLGAARRASGADALAVEPTGGAAVRRRSGAWIDAGGFGKGAALRSTATLLREEGARRALVELGGQLWVTAPADEPWSVSVAHPVRRDVPAARLRIHDVSVATSGTSERWVEVDGRRLGHILDPRTGRPAPAWGTVTVVHSDPLVADILSTALYVMGPAEGMRWLDTHPGIAALFLELQDGKVIPRWTGAMEPWLADAPGPTGPADAPTLDPIEP